MTRTLFGLLRGLGFVAVIVWVACALVASTALPKSVTVEGDRWTCDTNDAVATRSTRDQLNLGTIQLHHQPSVGLLVVRGPDLPHLRLHSKQGAREGQGGAPLPCTGLSGELLDAGLGVVVALHDVVSCVRRAQSAAIEPEPKSQITCGTAVFGLWEPAGLPPSYLKRSAYSLTHTHTRCPRVLVVDAARRAKRLFQVVSAEQGRGAPDAVDFLHGLRDVDVAICGYLLC